MGEDEDGKNFIYVDETQVGRRPPRFALQGDDEDAEMGDSL